MTMPIGKFEPQLSTYENRFQLYVAWVDQNSTVNDEQHEGILESISPQTGRNLHIGGFRLSKYATGVVLNVIVPQDVIGTFKMPQVGDIVWIEESRRQNGQVPVYMFSSYSSGTKGNPVPFWGSMPGDYGHIRTHNDHAAQFSTTTASADFRTKYIRSVTGYRFRSFYGSNLEDEKFVVRGDPVFDVEPAEINRPYLINSGSSLIEGGNVETDKGKYPEPLNVPKEREKEEAYTYVNVIYQPIATSLAHDAYDRTPKTSKTPTRMQKAILKNKNYMSYQPVMDRDYLDKASFDREIPAAEEYQVALRGNNKLLIQDQHGDGEQLIITLKTQYDEQFTIVHNGERGQVRIRDHLGQGVLLDADPESPRVISWTANKQVIEQGAVKGVGEFTYIRNGSAFGDSQTSFGTKTGLDKDSVPNQEMLMVSSSDIIGELSSRLSSGMYSIANSAFAPGIYFRNNTDPDGKSQSYSLYSVDDVIVAAIAQENSGVNGIIETSSFSQALGNGKVTQTSSISHVSPGARHDFDDVISVSGTEYTRTTTGQRVGDDIIVHNESIDGVNTAASSTVTTLPNGTVITTSEDGASSTSTHSVVDGPTGNTVTLTHVGATALSTISAESTSSIVDAVYDGVSGTITSSVKTAAGGLINNIQQTTSGVAIARGSDGVSNTIQVGNDSGTGQITIGGTDSPILVQGTSISIDGGTSISIDGGASVGISSPAVNITQTTPTP